jgi:hypothetical protein
LRLAGEKETMPISSIRDSYTGEILQHIQRVLMFITEADFSKFGGEFRPLVTGREKCERRPGCKKLEDGVSYHRVCYASIAFCYVIKHCPSAAEHPMIRKSILSTTEYIRKTVSDKVSTKLDNSSIMTHTAILLWYHYASVHFIYDYLEKQDSKLYKLPSSEMELGQSDTLAKR